MTILVTGGAGYIGSFMTKRLLDDGYEVIVIDNLSRGYRENIDSRAAFENGDLNDAHFLDGVFSKSKIDAVIHFAALISMAESMQSPGLYFQGNTMTTICLLEAMQKHGVDKIIFSSTAGVFGNPTIIPIPEEHEKHPTNPYGESKLMVENILRWYATIHKMRSVCFRYFNAAGAALDGSMGEMHDPESHLIPLTIKALLQNKPVMLYGIDYETKDGTCIRDYIHVLDLIEAHILGLKKLIKEEGAFIYNVGTGKGYSNREVIQMVSKVAQKEVKIIETDRRPGDASTLIADGTKIATELGFVPHYSELQIIVESAWKWHNMVQGEHTSL
jgi:UDP-glucose 4-epimerase